MFKWIPPRPSYRRERPVFGYVVLACALLLFVFRLLTVYLSFGSSLWTKLLLELVIFLLPAAALLFLRGHNYLPALRMPTSHISISTFFVFCK